MIVDLVGRKTVHIAEGKGSNVLESFALELVRRGGAVANITTVSQDMSPAFKLGVEKNFPEAKIVYDRFHVMKMIGEALDTVRKGEVRANPILKDSCFALLKNEAKLTVKQKAKLEEIKMKQDQPIGFLYDEITHAVYESSPYKNTVIGSEETVKALNEFKRPFYLRLTGVLSEESMQHLQSDSPVQFVILNLNDPPGQTSWLNFLSSKPNCVVMAISPVWPN